MSCDNLFPSSLLLFELYPDFAMSYVVLFYRGKFIKFISQDTGSATMKTKQKARHSSG